MVKAHLRVRFHHLLLKRKDAQKPNSLNERVRLRVTFTLEINNHIVYPRGGLFVNIALPFIGKKGAL